MNIPDFLLGLSAGLLLAVFSRHLMCRPRRKRAWRHYGLGCVAALILLFGSGCAGMRPALLRPVHEVIPARWETNTVPTLVTNRVADPVTDQVREVIEVSQVPVVTYTPQTVVTNWTPKAEAVAEMHAVGSLIPGWGSVAAYGASGLLTLWCGWLNRRNKKVSESLVMGIEDARKAVLASGNKELDAKIVDVLRRHQDSDGVGPVVAGLVDKLTGYTRT